LIEERAALRGSARRREQEAGKKKSNLALPKVTVFVCCLGESLDTVTPVVTDTPAKDGEHDVFAVQEPLAEGQALPWALFPRAKQCSPSEQRLHRANNAFRYTEQVVSNYCMPVHRQLAFIFEFGWACLQLLPLALDGCTPLNRTAMSALCANLISVCVHCNTPPAERWCDCKHVRVCS
jgi:hypothetical protein